MFEQASRLKLRFSTSVGIVGVEDLWDLPLIGGRACLNSIAKSLNKEMKESDEEDFVSKKSSADDRLKLMFDIVLHVIDTKKQEAKEKQSEAIAATRKDKLRAVLNEKKDAALKDMSVEEIEKLLAE
jgi:hypothetical protein